MQPIQTLSLLLTICLISLTPMNLAAAIFTEELELQDENSELDNDIDDDDHDAVPPVEIGPAGSISRESPYRTRAEEKSPVHFHVMWETRYITEGRGNLSGNPLMSFSTDLSYGNFTFAPWIAASSFTDYRELNLNLVYGLELNEQMAIYINYTHLRFKSNDDDSNDNEIAIEIDYAGFKYIQIAANCYRSLEADGSYYELTLRNENAIGKNLTLSTSLVTGLNGGYVRDGHRGVDNTQVRINLAYHPWAQIELFTYLSHSRAIHRDVEKYPDDTDLDDYTWGGLGATYRF